MYVGYSVQQHINTTTYRTFCCYHDVIHIANLLFQVMLDVLNVAVCPGTVGPIIALRCLAGTVRFVSVIGSRCGYIIGQSRTSFIQPCC